MDYVNESHDSKTEEAIHSDKRKFSNASDGPKRRHRQRQKEVDLRGDNPQPSFREPSLTAYDGKETGQVATHSDKVNEQDSKDIHTQASIAGNYYTDKTYRICSPNKSITLDNLNYYTYYTVSIRVCQVPVNNQSLCSEWRQFPTHTLPDRKMNAITYFAVEEANEKEGNKVENPRKRKTSNNGSGIQDEPLKTFSNFSEDGNTTISTTNKATGGTPSGNTTTISSEVDITLPGSTLILKWEPPKHPNGPPLEYIIRIVDIDAGQGGKERGIVCVPEERARLAGYRYKISGFEPGRYNISIKLRSQGDVGDPTTIQVEIPHSYLIWIVMVPLLSGILLGVCIIEAQVWFKKRRNDEAVDQQGNLVRLNGLNKELQGNKLEEKYMLKAEALQVDWEKQLGGGNFGMVYQGLLSVASGGQVKVAVKTLNLSLPYTEGESFLREAIRMQNINSNFVVHLIGVVANENAIYVVMGLMEKGDLKTYLTTPGNTVKAEKMIEMAVEAADGMAYLASKKLVHRDLAARNCMLDANLTLKIGDFGLTRYLQTDYYKKEGRDCLPVRWMAPESLQHGKYSSRSDVWSYGVLLWEIYTKGLKPYEGHVNEQVCELVVSGVHLEKPSMCPDFMYSNMLNCWKSRAKERPTFVQLVRLLLSRTSSDYRAYLEKVSFFHSSSCCDSESTEDNDEGFIASGSFDPSIEDEEEEEGYDDQCSFSNSLPPSPHLVDDDQVCLTPDDHYKRSSCASLSCISGSHTSQGIRLTPTRDTPYKLPHHRSSFLAEM